MMKSNSYVVQKLRQTIRIDLGTHPVRLRIGDLRLPWPCMYVTEESDSGILPRNHWNKDGNSPSVQVDGNSIHTAEHDGEWTIGSVPISLHRQTRRPAQPVEHHRAQLQGAVARRWATSYAYSDPRPPPDHQLLAGPDLGRRCHLGASHNSLESWRGGLVVASCLRNVL